MLSVGAPLRNGAILLKQHELDSTDHEAYKTVRSVVLGVHHSSHTPFVSWELEQDISPTGLVINELCVWGHYFKEIEEALADFDLRVNKEQHMLDIRVRGYSDGINAATWLVDGNTEDPAGVLKKMLDGIEDGDPEVLDALPTPRLSGEFADDPSWNDIIRDVCGDSAEYIIEHDLDGDLYDAYEEKFNDGVNEQIKQMHKAYAG